ncbi:MAG: hypothetical protein SF097_16885 [Acidobacteriota bacterium]|nr:hypothetical protein [Acidobacteriota bacterium]
MSKRSWLLMTIVVLAASLAIGLTVSGQSSSSEQEKAGADKWEYLIVAGGNVNLTGVGSEMSKRKADGSFREASVVQRNLDKLGQQGWELVTVHGLPTEPIYYLKRPKENR